MLKRFAIAVVFFIATVAAVFTTINRLYMAQAQEPARATASSPTVAPPAPSGFGEAARGYTQASAGYPQAATLEYNNPPYGYSMVNGNTQPLGTTTLAPPKPMSAEESKDAEEFQECLAKLRNPGDESVDEIREQMKTLLSLQLDRDLAQREESLKEIEKRASELRQQLEARRESKPETLKLLMTIVENPSAGFGLPNHWMRMLLPETASPGRYAPLRDAYYGATVGQSPPEYAMPTTAPTMPSLPPSRPRSPAK